MKKENELLYKNEVYTIVGYAMDILNIIGHGFHEKIYENALCVEFERNNVKYEKQKRYEIIYKDVKIGEYYSDLVVYDKIILEIKTADKIIHAFRGQTINYLKVSKLKLGLILNFKNPKLEWERIILSIYLFSCVCIRGKN